jgi:hypothetical protein
MPRRRRTAVITASLGRVTALGHPTKVDREADFRYLTIALRPIADPSFAADPVVRERR